MRHLTSSLVVTLGIGVFALAGADGLAQVSPDAEELACDAAVTAYLSTRDAMNVCTTDDTCAEIFPGLCPHGPHYIGVTSDYAALEQAIAGVEAVCEEWECEQPMWLGPARCDGRCVPVDGPTDRHAGHYDVVYLEQGARTWVNAPVTVAGLGLSAAHDVTLRVSRRDTTELVPAATVQLVDAEGEVLQTLAPNADGLYVVSLAPGVHLIALSGVNLGTTYVTATWDGGDASTHHGLVHTTRLFEP